MFISFVLFWITFILGPFHQQSVQFDFAQALSFNRLCSYEDLRASIFIVLPKKPRATECSDHRTISLMCHTLKLLLLIILKRITNKINVNVGPEQAGFRKDSGTREGIFNLRLITEKYLEKQKDIYACFIDYSKAFDTVKHQELLQCLKTTDIEKNDIALIANLYWQQKTIVKINNDISEPLKIEKGVRQGCVLSPSTFQPLQRYNI